MTQRLRDAQLDSLRCDQIARNITSALKQRGEEPSFDPRTRLLRSTDALGHTWVYQLALDGRVECITTPTGRRTTLTCDDRGRIIELREPSGKHTQVPSDEHGAPHRFVRNGVEFARFSWQPQHTACLAEFWDGTRAHVSWTTNGAPLRYVNRLNHVTTFEYDEAGILTSLSDGIGQLTHFEYDEAGRPAKTRHPDGRVDSLVYPAPGRMAFSQAGSLILDLQTDLRQQPVAASYADGNEYAFVYDDAGRIVEATGLEGVSVYEYRDDGKLLTETNGDQTFGFEYNSLGLLQAIVYPDDARAEFTYDPDRRLASVNWAGASLVYTYDKDDLRRAVRAPQFETRIERDTSGKPARTAVVRQTGATIFDCTYRYDSQCRLVTKTDSDFGEQNFSYDAESQLLGVANGRGQWRETFTYDGAGNRTFTSGANVEMAAGNRMVAQGNVRCEHDARGNLVAMGPPGHTWLFVYDLKNQLVKAQGPSGTIEFKYDAFGRRTEKRSAERTTRYVWCGEQLTREIITTSAGESVRDYLYHPGSFEPLAQRVDGQIYYYHNDHLGTPQRLTDDQGQVVWSAEYFAFGFAQAKGSVENPLRFLGQYADVETGLHYNRFRYYSPILGRYLSVDPAGLLAGHNLYLYALNDPINRSDPLGLFSWGAFGVAAAAAVATAVCVVAAPAAAAIAVVAIGALALGAVIGVGIVEAGSINNFCWGCFWKGAGKAAPTAFGLGLGLGALCVLCPPLGFGLAVGGAIYGTYAVFDAHYGWSGGKPFDQMNDNEKSEHLGGLVGGTVAGIAGGILGGLGAGAAVRAYPGLGRFAGPRGPAANPNETAKSGDTPKNEPVIVEEPPPPNRALAEKCGDMQDPAFIRNEGEIAPVETARVAKPGQPMELDPNVTDRYLYVVNEDGSITYAPQSPKGSPEIIKHPNLTEGGPARMGGEIVYDPVTDAWVMDASSGRLSTKVVGPPTRPGGQPQLAPNRNPGNVEAAAELARQSGTKQTIVANEKAFP